MAQKRTIKDMTEKTLDAHVAELCNNGYTVIPVLDNAQTARAAFQADMAGFTEVQQGNTYPLQVGAFGGLGNPSSFHCPSVRAMRRLAHHKALALFVLLCQLTPALRGYNFDQLFDRPCVRQKGSKRARESWHRDLSPEPDHGSPEPDHGKGDIKFGGWICLDDTPQYFSCVPTTQNDPVPPGAKGFAKEKPDILKAGKVVWKVNGKLTKKVTVKPGHMLIFSERILHEVLGGTCKETSYRLYTAWRLTTDNKPYFKDTIRRMKRQAPMRIKSGQEPAVYAKLHIVNNPHLLEPFKDVYKALTKHTYKSGARAGQSVPVPHVIGGRMPSLAHMVERKVEGVKMYQKYTRGEARMFMPTPIAPVVVDGPSLKRKKT